MSSFISSNMESASSQQQRSLSDLPIGALSHVSGYLTLPSRALFASALNCRDVERCSAIVGDQRDVLDFGDIEKELAAKLTDDDVRNILLSIDAINNLKTLRLTNLLNITGIGLEPLRGSTKIEKIDLSLVRDRESPDISPAPPISCIDVLPILDSIIDVGGECSLKLLIFPKEWRRERNTESEFHDFLGRYNALLRSRVVTCLKCDANLSDNESMMHMEDHQYGTQSETCHDCMKHYCEDCIEYQDGEEIFCISVICSICNRSYCSHCSREWNCASCDGYFCVDCMPTKQCAQCDQDTCFNCISNRECRNNCCEEKIWCNYCVRSGNAFKSCEICDTNYCVGCIESNTVAIHTIDCCNVCDEILCGKCRVIKCKERMGDGCTGCYRFAFPALLGDKERLRQEMQAEIDTLLEDKERKLQEMQVEIDEQKEENSELKEENNELKRKLEDLIGEVTEE